LPIIVEKGHAILLTSEFDVRLAFPSKVSRNPPPLPALADAYYGVLPTVNHFANVQLPRHKLPYSSAHYMPVWNLISLIHSFYLQYRILGVHAKEGQTIWPCSRKPACEDAWAPRMEYTAVTFVESGGIQFLRSSSTLFILFIET